MYLLGTEFFVCNWILGVKCEPRKGMKGNSKKKMGIEPRTGLSGAFWVGEKGKKGRYYCHSPETLELWQVIL